MPYQEVPIQSSVCHRAVRRIVEFKKQVPFHAFDTEQINLIFCIEIPASPYRACIFKKTIFGGFLNLMNRYMVYFDRFVNEAITRPAHLVTFFAHSFSVPDELFFRLLFQLVWSIHQHHPRYGRDRKKHATIVAEGSPKVSGE